MIYEKDMKSKAGLKDGIIMVESEIKFSSSSKKALGNDAKEEAAKHMERDHLLSLGDLFYMEARKHLSLLEQMVFPLGDTPQTQQEIKKQFDRAYMCLKIQEGEFSVPKNVG